MSVGLQCFRANYSVMYQLSVFETHFLGEKNLGSTKVAFQTFLWIIVARVEGVLVLSLFLNSTGEGKAVCSNGQKCIRIEVKVYILSSWCLGAGCSCRAVSDGFV